MAGAAPSAKPAPFLKPLDLLDRGILLAESSLSVVVVLAMVLFGVADGIGSILGIQHPLLRAAGDVLMHGTVWAAFLGASFATRGRKHLAIDALGRLLPDRARRVVVAISSTFGAVVAYGLGRGVYDSLVEQAHTAVERASELVDQGIGGGAVDHSFEFQFVIPIGFWLIAVRLLLHGFHELLAAQSPSTAPTASPPPAPAADEKEPHEEPDGTPSEAGDPNRVSPFAQSGPTEVAIACVALVVPIILYVGTAAFVPVVLAALAGITSIAVPMVLRGRKTKSYAATAPLPEHYAKVDGPVPLLAAFGGVSVVLALSYLGVLNLENVSIGMGILFFAIMALMGAPLFTFLGGMALFLWLHGSDEVPVTSLANAVEDVLGNHFARMSVLPTIPIFTLAGYLMSESKTPQRLVRVARSLLGTLPGGIAVVCVLASAGFTVFSGASGITIVAIGGLLLPALLRDKYPEGFSLGLVTSGGALGITFFPCLPLLVYGIVAGLQEMPPGYERVELSKMIYAGFLPGLVVIVLMMAYSMYVGVRHKVPRSAFNAGEAWAAIWDAKWELFLPIVVIVGLIFAGPLGAASFTACYVFIIEVFVYKDLSIGTDIPRIVPDSMVLVGAIFVKLCAATVLTFYFVQAQTADALFEVLTCGPPAEAYLAQHSDVMYQCREAVNALSAQGLSSGGFIDSPIAFLLALNVFLLVVGMLMDIFSAIVVIVPLIMGIALHFGINPYHLGIVFLINLEIGYLMPPMGLNLFIAGFRFGRPVPDLYRVVLPFIAVFVTALMITTYVPWLSLAFLPDQLALQAAAEEAAREAALHPEVAPTPHEDDGGGAETGTGADTADCEVPREGESFDEFEARCEGGGGGGGGAAPDTADCEIPREGETFDAFEARCLGGEPEATGAEAPPAPAPAADTADCEVPRAGESFDDFSVRCPM
jgi:C4-dicarboxylate transporter DctM subunit